MIFEALGSHRYKLYFLHGKPLKQCRRLSLILLEKKKLGANPRPVYTAAGTNSF